MVVIGLSCLLVLLMECSMTIMVLAAVRSKHACLSTDLLKVLNSTSFYTIVHMNISKRYLVRY